MKKELGVRKSLVIIQNSLTHPDLRTNFHCANLYAPGVVPISILLVILKYPNLVLHVFKYIQQNVVFGW